MRTFYVSIEIKRRGSLDVLRRGGWDLFIAVMGEPHCVGHQFWHLHDRDHERYDDAIVGRLGGDPVRESTAGSTPSSPTTSRRSAPTTRPT